MNFRDDKIDLVWVSHNIAYNLLYRQESDGSYIGECPSFPGCEARAKDLDSLKYSITHKISFYQKSNGVIELGTITAELAKYLRRKVHDWSEGKLHQAKRDRSVEHYELSPYFLIHVMLCGLEFRLRSELDKNII